MRTEESGRDYDLLVVGAGIVGLAHAAEAVQRGLSVAVVERDERAVGASVQNFGHGCVTAQSGLGLDYALAARQSWLYLAKQAGFWARETGTVVVARAQDELAVLEELATARDEQVVMLDRSGVDAHLGEVPGAIGGAFLPLDVRLDSRTAIPAIAAWLAEQGVDFRWATSVQGFEPGLARTNRGELRADRAVLAVGHDLDRFFPEAAADGGVRRCALNMLRLQAPNGRRIEPGVFTGLSLLRYSAFRDCPSLEAVRARFAVGLPEAIDAEVNLMMTQRPDGDLLLGDTHAYAVTHDVFADERLDTLLLEQAARLLGVPTLRVLERWRGTYAWSAEQEFLVVAPQPWMRAVAVTSGIGMTTALGLAPAVLDELLT